mgnify:CR=1 FL=1
MKRLFLAVLFIIGATFTYAAPFGLKMGMTIDEIADACNGIAPKYYERDIYFITPSKKHPLFETYGTFIDAKYGLYKIRCVSAEITTGDDGAELKRYFENALKTISKQYGTPDIIERPNSDAIDNDWFQKLRNGKISYKALWTNSEKIKNLNLDKIELKIISDDRNYSLINNIGAIVLNYDFQNATSAEDEQDSVF